MALADTMHMAGIVGQPVAFSPVPCRRFMKLSDGDDVPFDLMPEPKPRKRRRSREPVERLIRLEVSGKFMPVSYIRDNMLKLVHGGEPSLRAMAAHIGCSYMQICAACIALRRYGLIDYRGDVLPGRGVSQVYKLTRAGVIKVGELK
jgi:hypothetical protein